MKRFKRHDLVTLTSAARQALEFNVLGGQYVWPTYEVRRLLVDGFEGVAVPGIVRCQHRHEKGLGIGFSSPYRHDGLRLRVSARVPYKAVALMCDPYQVVAFTPCAARPQMPVLQVLKRACFIAQECGVACGVFGSVALELVTGLPYCHDTSDLDMIVRYENLDTTKRLYEALCCLEESCGIRIDTELELCDDSSVKLKEFFSDGDDVLVKGFDDVRLISKDVAVAMNHIQVS